jgi:hypothetical protein
MEGYYIWYQSKVQPYDNEPLCLLLCYFQMIKDVYIMQFEFFMIGIMVRGRMMSRRCGAGGRGMLPLGASMQEGSSPLGEELTIEQE